MKKNLNFSQNKIKILTSLCKKEEENQTVHLKTIGDLEGRLEESKEKIQKSESSRQELEKAKNREISAIKEKNENFLQNVKERLSQAVSGQKKIEDKKCRQIEEQNVEIERLKNEFISLESRHSDFVIQDKSREEDIRKQRKANAKNIKNKNRQIQNLKTKLQSQENLYIEDVKNDLKRMETRHLDFVATVKSLLVCDVSRSDENPFKRIENLTKSLNGIISIDFEVKEEAVEVKEEVVSPHQPQDDQRVEVIDLSEGRKKF